MLFRSLGCLGDVAARLAAVRAFAALPEAAALADKLETLVGLFGIGSLPTGDRDPFALRRHALGVLRILGEKRLPLELPALIAAAVPAFGSLIQDPAQSLLAFFGDRLAVSLREQGYSAQEVNTVLPWPTPGPI